MSLPLARCGRRRGDRGRANLSGQGINHSNPSTRKRHNNNNPRREYPRVFVTRRRAHNRGTRRLTRLTQFGDESVSQGASAQTNRAPCLFIRLSLSHIGIPCQKARVRKAKALPVHFFVPLLSLMLSCKLGTLRAPAWSRPCAPVGVPTDTEALLWAWWCETCVPARRPTTAWIRFWRTSGAGIASDRL